LKSATEKMVTMARKAGMAEIAVNILHNIGNVLSTSVTFSSSITETIKGSHLSRSLSRFVSMILPHQSRFAEFVKEDRRGKMIPAYIEQLNASLIDEHKQLLDKNETLAKSLEHIARIVDLQQDYAGVQAVTEKVPVYQMINDTLQIFDVSFNKHSIERTRE